MSLPEDVPAIVAQQSVATAILAPYLAGLVTLVLLTGLFWGLFIEFVKQGDWKGSPRRVKVVACSTLLFSLFCLGLAYEEIIDTGVTQKRSSNELFTGPAQSNILPILTGITSMICQTFLMARAAVLIPSRKLRYLFLLATTGFILAALTGAAFFSAGGYLDFFGRSEPMSYFAAEAMWLWSSAAADVLISIALSVSLHQRIRGFNATLDGVLRHLIMVGLRTAAYTAVTSIIGAATSTAFARSDNYHTDAVGFAFWVVLPALHCISLFTTLSTRRTFANALGSNGGGVISPMVHDPESPVNMRPVSGFPSSTQVRFDDEAGQKSTMSQTSSSGGGGGRGRRNVPLVVRVEQEREVTYDVRSSSDEDFLAQDMHSRRTIGGTPRESTLV
ncbi:hypothetical protein JCM10908_002857 [Rhodotorula pacifica]|uniref:DUF6534 domain-containing protein n=1 Tax=Rhodotorula pacifica TaxID=1495444 RepID=UPI0031752D64